MNAFLYRYGSICEPDILDSFQRIGLTVIEEKTEITEKNISNARRVQLVEKGIREHHPLFVFSINFYPAIAEICQIYQTPYFCWTVDSPVPELFSESIRRSTNRIFLFDHAQYTQFAPYNPECIFHLPLASAVERFDRVIRTISDTDHRQFTKDITFVGSLYNEKSPLTDLRRAGRLSQRARGYLDALEESALKIYGCNFIEAALADDIVQEIKASAPLFYDPGKSVAASETYVAAHSFVGMEVAMKERILTLQTLAKYFPVDLYTKSDTAVLFPKASASNSSTVNDRTPGSTMEMDHASVHKPVICENLHVHGGVASLTEMPKLFHLSKINLNMTIKPIQEGLPLRIFDILGCGGFCMTNYQPELSELFEIGRDLEAYASLEELVDKCSYYLQHEEVRQKIAQNGYKKVCERHTYLHRIKEMLQKATE